MSICRYKYEEDGKDCPRKCMNCLFFANAGYDEPTRDYTGTCWESPANWQRHQDDGCNHFRPVTNKTLR